MSDKQKFLVVLAIYDEKTQGYFDDFQQILDRKGVVGIHSRDIPYHVTLGSFAPSLSNMLATKINNLCYNKFSLEIDKIGCFGTSVVFAQPISNQSLLKLHSMFDGNYADGFDWHPHTTMFMDDGTNFQNVLTLANSYFTPLSAQITQVRLYLCEGAQNTLICTKNLQ